MSSSCISYLRTLFGQKKRSDCTVVFYCAVSKVGSVRKKGGRSAKRQKADETGGGPTGAKPLPAGCKAIGDPLPAHTVIICGGSERFQAEVDRWTHEPGSSETKPVLQVSLDCPDDLPHALAAIEFMYTGTIVGSDAASLLQARRLAGYLQVEGAPEACDEALLALIDPTSIAQQQRHQSGVLAGVLQLYSCQELFFSTDIEPIAMGRLLNACRAQLVKHAKSKAPAGGQAAVSAGGPRVGELLAWAFQDAPSLMSDPAARQQMDALPAAAMEALLGCDSFATDDEASVLVVLMRWLQANRVSINTRGRLLKLVRLSQLSDVYLLQVLPQLDSLGISSSELGFLQMYARAPGGIQKLMKEMGELGYDFASAWYRTDRRPAPSWGNGGAGGRSYEWCVDAEQLKMPPGQQLHHMDGIFANGLASIIANGFEWKPIVELAAGGGAAGVFVDCSLPSCLGCLPSVGNPILVHPGANCSVRVYKWGGDDGERRDVFWRFLFERPEDLCWVGAGLGESRALPLKAAPGKQAAAATGTSATAGSLDPQLARWAAT